MQVLTESKLAIHGGDPIRTKPWPDWPIRDEREVAALTEVTLSGKWWRGAFDPDEKGKVQQFEEAFAKHHRVNHCLAVTSGSGALEIAVRAAGIGPGDEVITTPYTFIATTTCILNNQAAPVYVDIEADSYNLNPDLIEAAITPRTRAILPVHFSGELCNMDKINAIARKHGLKVIEDACHAHGVQLDNGHCAGSFGDLAAFSFQVTKNMGCGEGGAITTTNAELAEVCWSLHHYGRSKQGAWHEHHYLGWNHRLTEFQAAVLLVQLSRLDEQNAVRMRNIRCLYPKLSAICGIEPSRLNPRITKHSHHIAMLRYDAQQFGGVHRDKFVEALNAEGIPAAVGYTFPNYANHFMTGPELRTRCPFVKVDYSTFREKCPVAERACREEAVWIHHPVLLADLADMDDIVRAISKIKENCEELN